VIGGSYSLNLFVAVRATPRGITDVARDYGTLQNTARGQKP
jgi:hypothetical protein